jgi:hypothetical protein
MSKAAELAKWGEVSTNGQVSGRRNLIINGAMNVAQRATSVADVGAAVGYFTCDRWKIQTGSLAGRLTMTQTADGPVGFANCIKLDCTTADTSIAAGEYMKLDHRFEGQDLQAIGKGVAGAKEITVSFYVKANAAFTFGCEVYDQDNTRQITKLFDTTTGWVRHELTFPADVDDGSSPFDDDNARSLDLSFWLHSGSDYTSGTLETAWANTTVANRAVGIDSFFSSTDNNFFITGVQLEVGSVATPFEHRSFGEELALCQRYYQQSYAHGTAAGTATNTGRVIRFSDATQNYAGHWITFRTEMRAAPTGNVYNTSTGAIDSIRDDNGNHTAEVSHASTHGMHCYANNSSIGGSEGVSVQYTAYAEI